MLTFGDRDAEEGVRSFLEKREPRFEGTMARDKPAGYPWWNAVDIGLGPESKVGEKAKL